jgi:hypothetical protein
MKSSGKALPPCRTRVEADDGIAFIWNVFAELFLLLKPRY